MQRYEGVLEYMHFSDQFSGEKAVEYVHVYLIVTCQLSQSYITGFLKSCVILLNSFEKGSTAAFPASHITHNVVIVSCDYRNHSV